MKLIIDIDEEIIEHAKGHSEDSNDEYSAMRSIENGIPLKDIAKDIQSIEVPKHSTEGFYICFNTISKIFDNYLMENSNE